MKRFKSKKSYRFISLGCFILLGVFVLSGCQKADQENVAKAASGNETEVLAKGDEKSGEGEKSEEEIKTLKGTIKEGMMNTIIILGEDQKEYTFERDDEKITTGESGLRIGNPITVKYKGDLGKSSEAQTVEVISMTVEDQT
ncbi:MAG: hypothetical protein SPI65_04050 [Peptoniphilus sp.]|nr:hypothetical protein [Peptoniphilus sp.]MDY6044737.1 hypothetical protein [Peptoniphilus sp.]